MQKLLHATVCIGTVLLLGCDGGSEGGRREVTGSVAYNGQPVEEGQIVFEPQTPDAPLATGQIKGGEYRIEAKYGPAAGPYRVRIEAYRKKKATGPPPPPEYAKYGMEVPNVASEQFLPPEYNARTTLQVEITESGENIHNFELPAKGGR